MKRIKITLFLFIAIVAIICIAFIIENIIRSGFNNFQEDIWVSSLASYWGGVLGGIVSGTLAFLSVFYTIQYYKESDAQKERCANLPFLLVNVIHNNILDIYNGFTLNDSPVDKDKEKTVYVSIQNIGSGFATTLAINTGYNPEGFAYKKVISVGDSFKLFFVLDADKLKNGLNFDIQYIDSMTNKYKQEYTIISKFGSVEIECGYPQLLK